MINNLKPVTCNSVTAKTAGFTLLEILIALMILSIGLASVFALYGTAAGALSRGVNEVTLSSCAQVILSELEAKTHPAALDLTSRRNQTHPAFPKQFTYDLDINPIAQNNTAYAVTLTIKWNYGAVKASEKFQTVILR